jgi:uncharacterized protein YecE (DUF72 family)
VPDGFQFAFKVCGDITLKRFPALPRFGARAGKANPHFLDATLFADAILAPYENIRAKVGLLMFEFSRFGPEEFERGAAFVSALDAFLEKLPRGWPYAVELRNRHWLRPEYFAVLARHGVTHIYNAWADMPPVPEQMNLPGSETNPACGPRVSCCGKAGRMRKPSRSSVRMTGFKIRIRKVAPPR